MSKKTIKLKLSTDSINEAIKQVLEYKEWLHFKQSILTQKLAEIGLQVIENNKYSQGDSNFNDLKSYVWIDGGGTQSTATLVLSGKDVAFIEFGAGIHYNGAVGTSPSEHGQKLGYTIGSYGLGKGANDSWVYFDEETGRFKTSHGTQAALPMTKADEEIRSRFIAVAKEVFESA